MRYSRQNPSPEYWLLRKQYGKLHSEGRFPGHTIDRYTDELNEALVRCGCRSMLDYGSANRQSYPRFQIPVTPFDFAIHGKLSGDKYDCVCSFGALDHVHPLDIHWVVEEVFAHARNLVFVHIACHKAARRLPDGRNEHLTVRHPQWWKGVFDQVHSMYPHLAYRLICVCKWRVWKFQYRKEVRHSA